MNNAAELTLLVADDTETDRRILEAILTQEGHRVVSVANGLEAVAAYDRERPDLVLLDALMPELDGFGAAEQIKELAGEELVPIIFLTSLTDSASLVQCLDAGGDDFLSKPYKREILRAKIQSFNRMRQMHATILTQRNQITQHHQQHLREQAVAKQVFDNIAHSGCLDADNVKHYLSSMAVFNGDVVVAARRPSGSMMVLLGDFTGHGLPAAIGAMPLASTFYGMVPKGFSMTDVLREINAKLKDILPVGVFCCAAMVDMDFVKQRIRVWNGGLPACFLYRREGGRIESVKSHHLPLGVVADPQFRDDCTTFRLREGDRFYMWSDGIHEARNARGDMYGEARLRQVFDDNRQPESLFDDILASVHSFVGERERDDDLSLVEVRMVPPTDTLAEPPERAAASLSEWRMELEVKPGSFRFFDPLPLLLGLLREVPGLRRHSGSLFTVLSELYSNALEHGVLKLPSSLKETAEGFERYYAERARRLDSVQSGCVVLTLSHSADADGGCLTIRVEDSGEGFTPPESVPAGDDFGGRGLALVEKLCDSVAYYQGGTVVEAVYRWVSD